MAIANPQCIRLIGISNRVYTAINIRELGIVIHMTTAWLPDNWHGAWMLPFHNLVLLWSVLPQPKIHHISMHIVTVIKHLLDCMSSLAWVCYY